MKPLKPCPFCGAPAVREYHLLSAIIRCERRNSGCPVEVRTHHGESEEIETAWNTRSYGKGAGRKRS